MTGVAAKVVVDKLRYSLTSPPGRRPGPLLRGLLATEIQAPRVFRQTVRRGRTVSFKTGSRSRADAIWAPNQRPYLVGYEVKVSRSDLMSELKNPDKATPWLQYCNEWWLVLGTPQLADGLMVPANWGVAVVPQNPRHKSLTVLQQAPGLKPKDQTVAFHRLIAWNNYQEWKRQQAVPIVGVDLDHEHDYEENDVDE